MAGLPPAPRRSLSPRRQSNGNGYPPYHTPPARGERDYRDDRRGGPPDGGRFEGRRADDRDRRYDDRRGSGPMPPHMVGGGRGGSAWEDDGRGPPQPSDRRGGPPPPYFGGGGMEPWSRSPEGDSFCSKCAFAELSLLRRRPPRRQAKALFGISAWSSRHLQGRGITR